MRLTVSLASAAILAAVSHAALADVAVPPIIGSHMVLQSGMNVPIWGTAAAGEKVTVAFAGQTKSATADAAGKWRVNLDPLKTAEPAKLTITGDKSAKPIELDDVLVGEVWVGSGQSNMAMSAGKFAKGDEPLDKLVKTDLPNLRLFAGGQWIASTNGNGGRCSGMLFGFGAALHQELKTPVGLMWGAVNGTPSGCWVAPEMLNDDPAYKAAIENPQAKAAYEAALKTYQAATQAAATKPGKPPQEPQKPGTMKGEIGNLYAKHITPFQPYAIRGVLWDQGESGTAIAGVDQHTVMGALTKGWRKAWGQDFPWIYIQKPSGGGCAFDYDNPVTAKADKFAPLPATVPANGQYREEHIRLMEHPKLFMAIASDLGSGLHPSSKSGYGARACKVALANVYGKQVEWLGPTPRNISFEGSKAVITFDHAAKGLVFKNGEKLQGFALAGEDKTFHWADAVISGNTITLTCKDVPAPKAVRYAWANTHPWANLFNGDGLPAQAFRSDKW